MPGLGAFSRAWRRRNGFAPAELGAGLRNWYDETSWTTSGSSITAWNDRGSGALHLAPTGGVTENATGGPNSEPCIQFDGTTGYLRRAYTTGQRREKVYFVCRPQSVLTANETLLDGGGGNLRRLFTSSTTLMAAFAGATLTVGATHTAWQILVADFNSTTSKIQVNNGTPATGSTGAALPNPAGLTLGCFGTVGSSFADVRAVELLITSGVESEALVLGYLNDKWGIY